MVHVAGEKEGKGDRRREISIAAVSNGESELRVEKRVGDLSKHRGRHSQKNVLNSAMFA